MGTEHTSSNPQSLAITIEGEGVRPERVNADEWLELVADYQKALVELATVESGEKPEGVYFTVTKIESKCIALACETSDAIYASAQRAGEAMRTQNRDALSEKVWGRLDSLASRVARREWSFIVRAPSADGAAEIIELHDPTQLPPKPRVYRTTGEWTLVGRCVRVNLENPDAALWLANEARTRVRLTGAKSKLKELARHLDEVVEVQGKATWTKPDWELEGLELESFEVMPDDPVALFRDLPESTREAFSELDPFEIRESLRGGDTE